VRRERNMPEHFDDLRSLRKAMAQALAEDRRDRGRMAIVTDVLVRWHHDPNKQVRYETLDLSEGGMRIRSSCALLEGMTGRVRLSLPDSPTIDRPAMVAWSRACYDREGRIDHFEAGIRLF
jgi:hypothetical protein